MKTLKLGPELFDLLNARQHVGNQKPVIYGQGGLSETQIEDIEKQLGFTTPEDFKYLLMNMKDEGGVMFSWGRFDKEKYNESLAWVLHGIEFDIEHNIFWLEKRWGKRPESLESCLKILRDDFPSWPKLLPLHGHRFLAAEPCLPDNPVFSVMQTDIIYYGSNLAHYLLQEFIPGRDFQEDISGITRRIDIWGDIVEREQIA